MLSPRSGGAGHRTRTGSGTAATTPRGGGSGFPSAFTRAAGGGSSSGAGGSDTRFLVSRCSARCHTCEVGAPEPAEIGLESSSVTTARQDGNVTRYPESHFLDWVVGGEPLRSSMIGVENMVTELNRPWLAQVPSSIDVLLGRSVSNDGLEVGRVPLFVCSVCGDYGCGVVTARLHVGDTTVDWADFRWEDSTSNPTAVDGLPDRIQFEKSAYERVLADAYDRLAEFPYDELTHTGRRFLWPWQWGWKLP